MSIRPTHPLRIHLLRTHLLIAFMLALFVALLYGALLFTNRVLATGDILLYFYPYRDYASEALRGGRLPFWNPYIFMGAPFLANPQAAVLYPLHLPLLWLSVTAQVYWSAAIHTWLLAFGGYLLMRRLGNGWLAGLITGLTLAGSGFYGGMIGHLNQMNAAAWLPWMLLAVTPAVGMVRHWRAALLSTVGCALVVAMMLLAGHTQTAYINLFGVGLWTLALAVRTWMLRRQQPELAQEAWFVPLGILGCGVLLGAMLAAPQLLPTLELSQLGIRSGGLSFVESTSFSLKPLALPWTLLPTYGLASYEAIFASAAWSEFVAWIGIVGLLLALVGAVKGRGLARWLGVGLVLLGLSLALGRWNPAYWLLHQYVPGFDLFRTPARWMMLYTMGAALLAGLGAEALQGALRNWRTPSQTQWGILGRIFAVGLLALVVFDLLLAFTALPQHRPTAPEAVYGLRTAPAHLMTDPERLALEARGDDPAGGARYLGMSTITYDPGDMADSARIYRDPEAPQLDEEAFNDLIIAQKVQELLVPNLSLLWRIPAVDGYDGGTLPLRRYNAVVALLAPAAELAPDGRLREQVSEVPPSPLLDVLNVRYMIADKVRDLWFEDVYYDRQIGMTLDPDTPGGEVTSPETFEATHLDLIGAVEGDAGSLTTLSDTLLDAVLVTVLSGEGANEYVVTAGALPGANLADDTLDSEMAQDSGAVIAYQDVENGAQEYRVRIPLDAPTDPATIRVELAPEAAAAGLSVRLQAATLLDERTGMFVPLLPSDRGDFALVHSGDVKVYENLSHAPRVWLAHRTIEEDSVKAEAERLAALIESGDARLTVVVGEGAPILDVSDPPADDMVEVLSYQPERIEIAATSAADGLLVVADANYPGWSATVDGVATPIHTTNVLFRGIPLAAGEHTVVLTFVPTGWRNGLLIGAVGAIILLVMLAATLWWRPTTTVGAVGSE